jgi:hypothetical protein
MAKTAKLRLLDAIEAIASINSFIGSLPLEDFLANAMVQAACHSFGSAGPEDHAGEVPGKRRERMTCKHQQIAVNLRRLGYEF